VQHLHLSLLYPLSALLGSQGSIEVAVKDLKLVTVICFLLRPLELKIVLLFVGNEIVQFGLDCVVVDVGVDLWSSVVLWEQGVGSAPLTDIRGVVVTDLHL
jgi:hypothetical protein